MSFCFKIDFVDFLESGTDLPRASSTSALSSASVLKMVSRMGETVNKITYKMEESDPWFQEKTQHIEQEWPKLCKQQKDLFIFKGQAVSCPPELTNGRGGGAATPLNPPHFNVSKSLMVNIKYPF